MKPKPVALALAVAAVSIGALMATGVLGILSTENPMLSIPGDDDCPWWVLARLTNNDGGPIAVSASGFQLVDASGTASSLDPETMEWLVDEPFPRSLILGPGETVEGGVVFAIAVDNPPYTLTYHYDGMEAAYALRPSPPGQDGCTEPPPPPRPVATFYAGAWGGENTWVVVAITSCNLPTVAIANLTYEISGANWTSFIGNATGSSIVPGNAHLSVTYNDAWGEGLVGSEDNLLVEVETPDEWHAVSGATLRVLYDGELLGQEALP